jgi:heptosyltransferase-2
MVGWQNAKTDYRPCPGVVRRCAPPTLPSNLQPELAPERGPELSHQRMTSRPLIVRLCNWIGDVVLGLPALQRLQDAGYSLHLYGKGWAPTLLSGYDWPVTVRAGTLREQVQQLKAIRQQAQAHDAGNGVEFSRRINALAMPNSFSSVLELRLAGFSVAGFAKDGRSLMLGQRIAPATGPHALESFWALAGGLVKAPGSQDLPPPEAIHMRIAAAALQRAQALVAERGWNRESNDGRGGYLCIAPFAAGTVHKLDKRWPGFPELARRLCAGGLTVVVCPGPGELEIARSAYPQAEVVENLPLDAYAALLQGSRGVIANDTGPGHIAAATGAPLISVLGPTKVEQWRPWGPNITLLSARPDWPTVDQVEAAARQRFGLPPAR